ncbi:hypothetical protein PSA7680_00886 [Pseudoruegeria aquimaris]|uniref:Phytanoyl-CoA dioxygenase (PhyH) n=1 Tax=Pseudoruegeria aquimaris TaxID=393663 RepID=A0A1Y5RPR3_9RHOB|nr:hypothetical protein [Pseudoruegeria aquimaris]SLN22509.1 hypothetical protein PSA7680_00886 [Pseudoruegeria aquimaris]
MSDRAGLRARGWLRFPADAALRAWAEAALPAARVAIHAPENAHWHRHGGTWFAGVNALENDASGRIGGVPLAGAAVEFIARHLGAPEAWDKAQISAVLPGYPGRDAGESDAAHRFRLRRDAAHVDGLLPVGPRRRRKAAEPHAFILGIALNQAGPEASPLVVWEGSHEVIRAAFLEALDGVPQREWAEQDLTDIYQATRRRIFETCPRRCLPLRPGEAILLHRLALHGIAPWQAGAQAGAEGRVIAYFRPPMPGGVTAWLATP